MSRQQPAIGPKPRSPPPPSTCAQYQSDAKASPGSPPATFVSSITVPVKRPPPPPPPHPPAASKEQQEPSKAMPKPKFNSNEFLGPQHRADIVRAEEAAANTAPPPVSPKPTKKDSPIALNPNPTPVAPTPAAIQDTSSAMEDRSYKEQPNGPRSSSGSLSPASSGASTPNCSSPATRFQTGHQPTPDAAAPCACNIIVTTPEGINSLGAAATATSPMRTQTPAACRLSRVQEKIILFETPLPNQQPAAGPSDSGSPFMRNSRAYASSPHLKSGVGRRVPSQAPQRPMRLKLMPMYPVRESVSEERLPQDKKKRDSSVSKLNAGCREAQMDLTISGAHKTASAEVLSPSTNDILEEAHQEPEPEEVVRRPKRPNSTGPSAPTAPAAESEEERAARAAKKRTRAFDTAKELLDTERTFLIKLNHIEQVQTLLFSLVLKISPTNLLLYLSTYCT